MSYNITNWKIRQLYLELPSDFDFEQWLRNQPDFNEKGYENVGKRWCLKETTYPEAIQANLAKKTWKLDLQSQMLSGIIEGNKLITSDLDWRGDGSGHLYTDILLPLFKEFKGTLEALVIWEGGDSIYQLNINNGIVEEVEIK